MEAAPSARAFSPSSSPSAGARPSLPLAGLASRRARVLAAPPPPRAVASSRAPLVVSSPPPPEDSGTHNPAHAKVDRSGRFCSPRAARELALMISYAACLEGTDVVRLFDRRISARRVKTHGFLAFHGYILLAVCPLISVSTRLLRTRKQMYFQLLQNLFTTTMYYGIPSFLPHSTKGIRLSRELLVAVASGWDKHVVIIDKIIPQAWKDEPVARILELCILHIAMAEMASKGTPHKVVINEAVDLAKRFCDGGAPRVINGCLRTFVKDHVDVAGTSQEAKSKS
ncbi:antitermination NusB domain-containing protein [Zea mays]|uniref:Antitermination NusB domain-containing protein n=1 Tax=Zea mays TaxID=4577 RepID=A0A1D6GL66_MAIZE|nr:antitermination NusB domain-containing protein [Zea mays]